MCLRRFERNASAAFEYRAVGLLARRAIVDAVTVAAAQASFGAKPPNRVLHEAWKIGREGGIEPARIDVAGDALDNRGAASRGIAAGTVGVVSLQLTENAGAVQEIVHQGIDAIITAPASIQSGRLASPASSSSDSAIASTLFDTP